MFRPPQNSRFFSSKSRKAGKWKQQQQQQKASGAQAPAPAPPPIPREAFPRYSPTSSTPLPPPAMPKKPLLRRVVFPFLIAGAGVYILRPSNKESSKKDDEIRMEISSLPASIEAAVLEKTAP